MESMIPTQNHVFALLFGGIPDVVTVCVNMVHVLQQINVTVMTSSMDIYAANAMPV